MPFLHLRLRMSCSVIRCGLTQLDRGLIYRPFAFNFFLREVHLGFLSSDGIRRHEFVAYHRIFHLHVLIW